MHIKSGFLQFWQNIRIAASNKLTYSNSNYIIRFWKYFRLFISKKWLTTSKTLFRRSSKKNNKNILAYILFNKSYPNCQKALMRVSRSIHIFAIIYSIKRFHNGSRYFGKIRKLQKKIKDPSVILCRKHLINF